MSVPDAFGRLRTVKADSKAAQKYLEEQRLADEKEKEAQRVLEEEKKRAAARAEKQEASRKAMKDASFPPEDPIHSRKVVTYDDF